MLSKKVQRRRKVKFGIRKKIKGTSECPRLSVFRSNKAIYAQLIDDIGAKTMASASSKGKTGSKIDSAKEVGQTVAAAAKSIGVEKIVFDRGGYLYHGRIKALAEGAREGGLKF